MSAIWSEIGFRSNAFSAASALSHSRGAGRQILSDREHRI
jgi:hypothetical protein